MEKSCHVIGQQLRNVDFDWFRAFKGIGDRRGPEHVEGSGYSATSTTSRMTSKITEKVRNASVM